MKNIFIAILLSMTLTYNAFGQETKNEIRVSYGFFPVSELLNYNSPLFIKIFISPIKNIDVDSMRTAQGTHKGCVNFEYNRYLKQNLSLGFSLSYNPLKYNFKFSNGEEINNSCQIFSLLAKSIVYVVPKQKYLVLPYITISLGGTYYYSVTMRNNYPDVYNNVVKFAYNLGAGLRVGRKIGGYLELGVGYEGLIIIGFYGKF